MAQAEPATLVANHLKDDTPATRATRPAPTAAVADVETIGSCDFICGVVGRVGGTRQAWHGTCLVPGPTQPPATVAAMRTDALRIARGFRGARWRSLPTVVEGR